MKTGNWMVAAALIGLGTGCSTGGECEVAPGAWDAPDFETNASESLALRGQLDDLVGTMRDAETGDTTVTVGDLEGLYQAGSPSLQEVANPEWGAIIDDAFVDFVDVIDAGAADLVDDDTGEWSPGEHGGIWEESFRGIDEGGIETRQIVDKGLFSGGAHYAHAVTLTEGDITPATVEAMVALWGSDATLDPENRTDSANYSFGMGYHAGIADAFTAAHAYAADEACTAQRDEALVDAFRGWEESLFARFVYYAADPAPLFAAPGSDADLAQALHLLAEGLGLGMGFYGVPTPDAGPLADGARVATDADVEAMLDLFGVVIGDLGASTTSDFVTDPSGYDAAVDDLEADVGEIFDLTEAEVDAFSDPTGG